MTVDEIKAKFAEHQMPDIRIETADNGECLWARLSRHHDGHHYSLSRRISSTTPDETEVDTVIEAFQKWWGDERE